MSRTTATALVEYGGPLPSGWSSQDLGGPGRAGAAAYDAGTFGLVGGGSDIGGTWDQFRFAYGQVTTDVDIVVPQRASRLHAVNRDRGARPPAPRGAGRGARHRAEIRYDSPRPDRLPGGRRRVA